MQYIKFFNQISKEDVTVAGGKGASLGEMTQVGIPVPPGFVLLASAFDTFLVEADIGVEIATHILHDGDLVEVDANTGVVRVIEKANR